MPIDWNAPLQTRHDKPRKAEPLADDGIAGRLGKRRVMVSNITGGQLVKDPLEPYTVYLYDERGRCNCSGKDSPFDLVNVADTMAKAA
jgi:hypothetical protein